jgi:parallel beta-helix repeat protein
MTRNDRAVGVTAGLVACLALVAIVGLALPAGAQDGGGATEIDQCRNITEPGSYELTADITDSGAERCIWIQSSNVSVDGQGHTIDGVDGADTIGIEIREPTKVSESAEELSNVDVTDAVVTDWAKGLSYFVVTEGSVTDLRVASNDEGIDLEDASQFAVAGNTITANEGSGITDFGANAEIADNEITDNGGSGIALSGGSYDIRNNTVNDNAGNGISLLASFADAGTITNNTASGNGFDGIDVADSLPDRIADNTAIDNGRAGISLEETFGLELTGNTVNDNARGIDVALTDNTTIEDTVARENTEWAFYSDGTSAFPPAEPNTVRNLTTGSATVSFEELGVALNGVASPPADPAGRTNVGRYVNATSTRKKQRT